MARLPKNAKNDQYRRLDRRKVVADRYLQGWSQHRIAEHLKCSQSVVSDDLAAVKEEWIAAAVVDFDAARAKELARIDRVEEVAWAAWERSCEDAVIVTTKRERRPGSTPPPADGSGGSAGARTPPLPVVKSDRRVAGQSGNPAFLDRIAWCIEARIKLLALVKVEKGAAGVVVNINWAEMTTRPEYVDPLEEHLRRTRGEGPRNLEGGDR